MKNGTRLPEDWEPSETLLQWAQDNRPDLRHLLPIVVEDFKDYWLSTTGTKATKLDWDRTFKRWIRTCNARTYHRPNMGGGLVL